MTKLIKASTDVRLASSSIREKSTLNSNKTGYQYAIITLANNHEQPIKLTEEQYYDMCKAGLPVEGLILTPAAKMKAVHDWKLKHDNEYAKLFVKPKKNKNEEVA